MKVEKYGQHSLKVKFSESEYCVVNYVVKGLITNAIRDYIRKCNCLEIEDVLIFENSYTILIENDSTYTIHFISIKPSNPEFYTELLSIIQKYDLKPEIEIQEVNEFKINNSMLCYDVIYKIVENYSKLNLLAYYSEGKIFNIYFCPKFLTPWIIHVQKLSEGFEELYFCKNFTSMILKLCNLCGFEIENIYDIWNYIHNFNDEFSRFLASTLEIEDAIFTGIVKHHGKDRAHKYVIPIPPEVQEKLILSPGTKVLVKIRILNKDVR